MDKSKNSIPVSDRSTTDCIVATLGQKVIDDVKKVEAIFCVYGSVTKHGKRKTEPMVGQKNSFSVTYPASKK